MKRAISILLTVAGVMISLAALEVAAFQRPPGGPPPGGPGGFGPGMFIAPRILDLADADNDGTLSPDEAAKAAGKLVRNADRARKGSIDAETLGNLINRNMGPPPGFGLDVEPDLRPEQPPPGTAPPGTPGGPPPGGPDELFPGGAPPGAPGSPGGGFGPGNFIAPQIIAAADADKDGRLSPEEAGKAAGQFVRDADTARKGSIDTDVLAQAMNRRLGPPPGFGPGGPMGQEKALVKKFDKDGDKRLNRAERNAARASLKKEQAAGKGQGPGGRRGFGPPPGGFGGRDEPAAKPGPKVAKSDVPSFGDKPLYDPKVIRTLFLDFEDKDWEAEMADFYKSDVEVPATLTVDGKKYPGVGVHFRGMSSFFAVREGHKRSLNVSVDYSDPKQRLLGYKTLNLLNSHEDPSFLHTVLYFDIARQYVPAPKANFVRVVINGESWGLYVNAQQFDKIFVAEHSKSAKGARWKVRGSPGGAGGLDYIGDKVEDYKARYEMKSGKKEDWNALITLCRTLSETPAEKLEAALAPMLDIDGALWFLALDNALINSDGYWVRASDYSIFRDQAGKFHVIPHDANETFQAPMGPGMGGGGPGGPGGRGGRGGGGFGGRPPGKGFGGPPGKGAGGAARKGFGGGPPGFGGGQGIGVKLDPLIGLDDDRKPLRSKLLAVPSLKARYLSHVREIADKWLDWKTLGPIVAEYRALIENEVEADTRKLTSTGAFTKVTANDLPRASEAPARGRPTMSLREFAQKRRDYLLNEAASKKAR